MSLLYIGTFGSFIGFSFAFGQVLQMNFIASGQNAAQASLHAAQIAFLGPLLGSLSRVYGGRLADRLSVRDIRWNAWLPALACLVALPLYALALSAHQVWTFISIEFAAELLEMRTRCSQIVLFLENQ